MRTRHASAAEVSGGLTVSKSPYVSEIVGVYHALVHSSYAGWIVLCVAALALCWVIAVRDGSQSRRADEHARIELLRR
ncbi:MAG: hypothetical protein ACTHJM_01280 [Marmoricola sp.]